MAKTSQQSVTQAAKSGTSDAALSQASETTPRVEKMTLAAAVASLDPENEEHWNQDGSPKMSVLEDLTGGNLTRADVDAEFPGLKRDTLANADAGDQPPQDNDHVEVGAEQFATAVGEQAAEHDKTKPPTVEDRLASLEADQAFLRSTFGWPTKA